MQKFFLVFLMMSSVKKQERMQFGEKVSIFCWYTQLNLTFE